jgi:hypothetical protein
MPAFFCKHDGQWQLVPVAASPSLLRLDPVNVEPFAATGLTSASAACLLVRVAGQNRLAALVAGDVAIRHNGVPVTAGLRILEHRDALALEGGGLVFWTTEELAHVEPFAGAEPVSCPRCLRPVHPGHASVRCPSCGVVHHEVPERDCWTYAAKCALCPQPTALDAGLRWTPEEL